MSRSLLPFLLIMFLGKFVLSADSVDQLPSYEKSSAVSGRLRTIGSDSMDNLMKAWEKEFKQHHPKVRIFHQGKGSSTAIPTLMERRAEFGPMSRPLTSVEINKFETTLGASPEQVPVGMDAIVVFVHPDNPIAKRGLTLTQLKQLFGADAKGEDFVKTWGDIGVSGQLADQPINRYSRNVVSGTRKIFQKAVLEGGEFGGIQPLPGSRQVVSAVAGDPSAIGYSSIAYADDGVAIIPLAAVDNDFQAPLENGAINPDYPLTRELYLIFMLNPDEPTYTLKREFLQFVLSRDGQQIAMEQGLFPVIGATTINDPGLAGKN